MHRQDTEEQTEEEYKRELEQQTLNRLRNFLCDHLEPERFFPYLQTKEYLDPESCERIRSAGTTRSRVNKMLDILIRSGPRPLQVLIRAIKNNGPTQKFVTDKMNGEYVKVCNDPVNIERLNAIRMQPIRCTTAIITPRPPPYEPPINPHGGMGQTGSFAPSSFTLNPSTMGHYPNVSAKTVDPLDDGRRSEPARNGTLYPASPLSVPFHPKRASKPPTLPERPLPITPSEAPDSIFARFPSSFHTADFPPSYAPVRPLGLHLHSPTMIEILSHQHEEEQKISLNTTTAECTSTMTRITSTQEKELAKYNSLKPKQRRVPSEHDASVVTSRSSPTNISPTPLSPGNSETASGSSAKASTDESFATAEATTPTRMRNLKSLMSSSESIQPSCFTSSSFGNYETCKPGGSSLDPAKVSGAAKLTKAKLASPFTQHSPARQYSTMLETIPSIGIENTENQVCTSTRLPPTEHDDTSIVPTNQSDEDTSSLEISTDSEASEQQ